MPQTTLDFENELERAIATYADPVDAGHSQVLAARVAATVHARRQKLRWLMGLTVAIPVLGCLLIVALLDSRLSEPQHRGPEIAAIPSTSPSATAPQAPSRSKLARRAILYPKPRQLPKLDQFPTPAPITEQERLLVQFVGRAPQHTQQLIAKTQKQSDEPLRIAELAIPKLDSGSQPQ